MNRTVWPSGNMAGEETASGVGSNRASGLPPESETVHNPRSDLAKAMTPADPQLAPPRRPATGKSQMSMGGPPLRATFFNLFPAPNPTHRPSGEKKGYSAPSVPGMATAWASASGRRYSIVRGEGSWTSPTNTMVAPSGAIAKAVRLGRP